MRSNLFRLMDFPLAGLGSGMVDDACSKSRRLVEEGIKEGAAEGVKEGIKEGIKEGAAEGLEEGINEGAVDSEGAEEGISDGAEETEGVDEGEAVGYSVASGARVEVRNWEMKFKRRLSDLVRKRSRMD